MDVLRTVPVALFCDDRGTARWSGLTLFAESGLFSCDEDNTAER